MKGYRLHRWGGPLEWEELDVGSPGPDEVAVAVEACGVGSTVVNCIQGNASDDPGLLPLVPGHEMVGRVVEAGPGVGGRLVGERVVAYFYLSCGACPECRTGDENRCRDRAGWVGVHRDGGYAPLSVLPARNVIPVPEELDPVAATVIPDAVATPLHVSRSRVGIRSADRVVVVGAGGGVGSHMVQVARLDGAEVVGLDVHQEKLALIEELGARPVASQDFSTLDPLALFEAGAPTVIVDFVGSEDSLAWGLAALAVGGRLAVMTAFPDRSLNVDPRRLVFREVSLLGSRYATKREVGVAAALVAAGTIRPIIGETVGPAGLLKLHDRLERGLLLGRGALDWRTVKGASAAT